MRRRKARGHSVLVEACVSMSCYLRTEKIQACVAPTPDTVPLWIDVQNVPGKKKQTKKHIIASIDRNGSGGRKNADCFATQKPNLLENCD